MTAADMSLKQTLLRFYEAEAAYMAARERNEEASFVAIGQTLAPGVVLHQSPDLPFGGEYAGRERYEEWAIAMSNIFDRLEVRDRKFFESGDTVVVTCRLLTHSRVNGSFQDLPMTQVVKVKDGEITEFRPFYWNVPAYTAAARPAPAHDGGAR